MSGSRLKLRVMIITALFAAIISILAQIAIPTPFGVPLTGQTLAIGLAATILGSRYGTLAVSLYLLLGAVGVPVFAHFSGGLGIILGPTGGFLMGFIPATWLIGYFLEKTRFAFSYALIANIIGMIVTLLTGTLWLKVIADLSWGAAFVAGFIPFLIAGLIKAFIAASVGIIVRDRLKSARLLNL